MFNSIYIWLNVAFPRLMSIFSGKLVSYSYKCEMGLHKLYKHIYFIKRNKTKTFLIRQFCNCDLDQIYKTIEYLNGNKANKKQLGALYLRVAKEVQKDHLFEKGAPTEKES